MTDGQQIDMTPLDYGRSFLIGKGAANEVRFWIESRTRIVDDREGVCEDFYQTASCKSENTFDEKDLFQADNYDFLPIFSARHGLIFRRHAYLSDRYRDTRPYEEMFGGYDLHLVEGSAVRELPSNAAVREETYRFAPLVSQTEIGDEGTGLRALIECPVKTMNTRRGTTSTRSTPVRSPSPTCLSGRSGSSTAWRSPSSPSTPPTSPTS